MLSYLLKPKRAIRQRAERSPFSSPYAGGASSPLLGARHAGPEHHRRPAADYDHDEQLDEHDAIEESDGDGEEDEDEVDEDGDLGTPLLPIFSAAHLGNSTRSTQRVSADSCCRRYTGLQPHSHDTLARCTTMRDNALMGPAEVASGLAISRQADTTADSDVPSLESYALRPDGELLAVQKGGTDEPGEFRHE